MKIRDYAYHRRQWKIKAPLGLVLIGLGVSLVSSAAVFKYDGAPTLEWVAYGTLALVVLNSGLSVLVRAGVHQAHYERLRDESTPPN
jgi:hypothetical protein